MNLALAHCWKEWRAQRAILVAYVVLVTASLCIGFSLVPEQWWKDAGWSRHALSWFVAAGVIGVVAFVAPGLVRHEFGAKEDQFVRRLPGALTVSFAGKLLFATLAACGLGLTLLVAGEAFLLGIGQPWLGLFDATSDGEVRFVEPLPWELARYALFLAPFVWAIATWLPNGRMAIGGTALFVLFVGMLVTAVLRQSPDIERGLQWRPWLWAVPLAGVVTAFASWVKGRLGGGAPRSAKFGLAAFAVCALPPSLWLGNEVARFHHPDPRRLAEVHVTGITPDRRFVLATGSENEHWCGMPFRIDLATGEAKQVGAMGTLFAPHIDGSNSRHWQSVRRFWGVVEEDRLPTRAFDLATGAFTAIPRDATTGAFRLPGALEAPSADDARAASTLRGPDGERVWLWNDDLCVEDANGRVSRTPFDAAGAVRAAGHGFRLYDGQVRWFDFRGTEFEVRGARDLDAWCVRGRWLFQDRAKPGGFGGEWMLRGLDGAVDECVPLRLARVLGLLDDDWLLCSGFGARGATLFLYRLADAATRDVTMPESLTSGPWFLGTMLPIVPMVDGSLLPRDPAGRVWVRGTRYRVEKGLRHDAPFTLLLDAATLRATEVPHLRFALAPSGLLGWPDAHTALVVDGAQIVRIDVATGERTVLFPRAAVETR